MPWQGRATPVASSPTGNRGLFRISDRLFILAARFQLTVVHLDTEQRERRGKIRPRKAVGCECARRVERVLSPRHVSPPASHRRCRPTYSFDQEGKHSRKHPDDPTSREKRSASGPFMTPASTKRGIHTLFQTGPRKQWGLWHNRSSAIITTRHSCAVLRTYPVHLRGPRVVSIFIVKPVYRFATHRGIRGPPKPCMALPSMRCLDLKGLKKAYRTTRWAPKRPQTL